MAVQNVPQILMKHKRIQINISLSNLFDGMSIFYSNQEVNRVVGAWGACSAHCAVWTLESTMWRLESGVWSLGTGVWRTSWTNCLFMFLYMVWMFSSIFVSCMICTFIIKKSTYCKLVMGHYNSIFMPGAHLERWHTKKAQKIFLFIMYLLYCCCCSLLFFFKILQAAKVKGAV